MPKTPVIKQTVSRFFAISKRPAPAPTTECKLVPSKYFQPARRTLSATEEKSAYANFESLFLRVFYSKPMLIQELVCGSPWSLLIAVILLNKTNARAALPMFWYIRSLWPTPQELSQANLASLEQILNPLGLQNVRAKTLIEMSQMWIKFPPKSRIFYPSRVNVKGYPRTPISHLPGCGKYALDSYRIFCGGRDEWKSVQPDDKELIKYVAWKWAVEEFKSWDPVNGVRGDLTREDMERLPERLQMPEISTSVELQLAHFERPSGTDVS